MSAINSSGPSEENNDRLKCYFSLLSSQGDGIWVDGSGVSMLPILYKGVRVHIKPEAEKYEIGQIVVFHRDDKFIAHRVIHYDPRTDLYTTKGDTLFFFDPPCHGSDLLGVVDKTEKHGRLRQVTIDPELARLSGRIGNVLITSLKFLPKWMKFIYYFTLFIPGAFIIYLKK